MVDKMVVGVSQARQNFFELIELAQQGREILVEKRGKLLVTIKSANNKEKEQNRRRIKAVSRLAQIDTGLSLNWDEMEKIISTLHHPHF